MLSTPQPEPVPPPRPFHEVLADIPFSVSFEVNGTTRTRELSDADRISAAREQLQREDMSVDTLQARIIVGAAVLQERTLAGKSTEAALERLFAALDLYRKYHRPSL